MRTFIAVELPDDLKDYLADLILELSEQGVKAKWVAADNLHITLKFLGDISEDQVAGVIDALRAWSHSVRSFRVKLTELGSFPVRGVPRVLFIGLDQQSRLERMAEKLDQRLQPLGFSREIGFKAHLTLARFKGKMNRFFLQEQLEKIHLNVGFRFKTVVLLKSTLTKTGPIYDELYRVELNGPSAEGPSPDVLP